MIASTDISAHNMLDLISDPSRAHPAYVAKPFNFDLSEQSSDRFLYFAADYFDSVSFGRTPTALCVISFSTTSKPISGSRAFATGIGEFHERVVLEAQVDASSVWRKRLLDSGLVGDIDSLTETIDSVYESVETFGPRSIDLRYLKAEAINAEQLAAVLRATAPISEQVPGWRSAVEVARIAAIRDGIDPEDALFGLI